MYNELDNIIKTHKNKTSQIYIGADTNAKLGILKDWHENNELKPKFLGNNSTSGYNNRGILLGEFLIRNDLCAASTFFGKPTYTTFTHIANKEDVTYDHIFIKRNHLKFTLNAGVLD